MELPEDERQRITDLSREGYQHLRENNLATAEECFRAILEIEENNNYALVGLGDTYRKRRRCREAVEFYKQCLVWKPENNYALFGLADCYKAMKQFNRAIEVWEEYLKYDSENVTVLTRVADAHRKARNFNRSRELYYMALEQEPENDYALIGLGHLHYDFRMFREALDFWKRMYNRPNQKPDIRVLTAIGNCYRKLKQFDKGCRIFEEALQREPNNFYALFGVADCYRGLDESHKSLEYWNRILEQNPENKVILTRAGDAYRELGDYDRAEMYYKRALNIEFDLYAVFGLAMIAKSQERYDDAMRSLSGLLEADPGNHRFALEAANCALKLGRTGEARSILEKQLADGAKNRGIQDLYDRLRGGQKASDANGA
ncbi:MAG: tetratricopeptide repeat protein [Spirochaetales bacterium]